MGPALKIQSDSALHLGIIINELLTNGIKYVKDAVKTPILSISYQIKGDQFQLSYSDNGPGRIQTLKQSKGSGTGQHLIHLSTQQLEGRYNDIPVVVGVTLCFTFPKSRILGKNR